MVLLSYHRCHVSVLESPWYHTPIKYATILTSGKRNTSIRGRPCRRHRRSTAEYQGKSATGLCWRFWYSSPRLRTGAHTQATPTNQPRGDPLTPGCHTIHTQLRLGAEPSNSQGLALIHKVWDFVGDQQDSVFPGRCCSVRLSSVSWLWVLCLGRVAMDRLIRVKKIALRA